MNPEILEQNLTALARIDPAAAEIIARAPLEGFKAELARARNQQWTARVAAEETGEAVLLHSRYDPGREAERWAEGIRLERPTNVAVLGAGLGYHLLAHLRRHEKNTRFLFVIERDPRILKLAMGCADLRAVIRRNGTVWIVGVPPEAVPGAIGERMTDVILHNCRIVGHDPSEKCHPAYYAAARQSILDAITYEEINLRTNIENRGRNQFNILMNLPAIFRGLALRDCRGLFEGMPGVVAAAGPSLDKNVGELRHLGDRAPLIAVDTAQATLKKHGIEPDFIVTADPTPLNFSHFEAVDSLGKAVLAFHPEVNRQIPGKFADHPRLLPLFDGESPMLEHVFRAGERYGSIPRAMNVGHIAYHLALHLGCSPIILAGFDFAFPPKGGTTHAADAALSRAIEESLPDGTTTIGEKTGKAARETGKMHFVPGYYGEPVPTTVPFTQYIKAIEKTIAASGVETIDATEGGAAFEGTRRQPLAEALAARLGAAGAENRMEAFLAMRPAPPMAEIMQRLQEGRAALAAGLNHCGELRRHLSAWRKVLAKGPVDRALAERMWREFDRVWIEMTGPPLFDAFLGTSAQYIYYRRRRADVLPDESGEAFLRGMEEKYTYITDEMRGLLEQFIQCLDIAAAALQAAAPAGTRP